MASEQDRRCDLAVSPKPTPSCADPSIDDEDGVLEVRQPCYRTQNLLANDVVIRIATQVLPNHVLAHVQTIRAGPEQLETTDLTAEDWAEHSRRIEDLASGCTEADVRSLFIEAQIFPGYCDSTYGHTSGLKSTLSVFISRHLIPNNPDRGFNIARPKVDHLYGYSTQPDEASMLHPASTACSGLPRPQESILCERHHSGPGISVSYHSVQVRWRLGHAG
jgi:hypothetical protein